MGRFGEIMPRSCVARRVLLCAWLLGAVPAASAYSHAAARRAPNLRRARARDQRVPTLSLVLGDVGLAVPNMLLSGLTDLSVAYGHQLEANPLLTKSLTSSALFGVSDVLAQIAAPPAAGDFSPRRVARFMLTGIGSGVLWCAPAWAHSPAPIAYGRGGAMAASPPPSAAQGVLVRLRAAPHG